MYIFQLEIFWVTIAPSWYGAMYAISFILGYYYLKKLKYLSKKQIEDLFLYIFLWVILWGRLGYVLFYNFSYYTENFFDIFKVWEGWMSFHGGLLWVLVAVFIYIHLLLSKEEKKKVSFFWLTDKLALAFPIGLFFWRIGNYINGELLGFSPYTGPFAYIKDAVSYFPSSLLEAFLEWICLFCIVFFIHKRYSKSIWVTSAAFLIGYGVFRSIVEIFFRMPDAHIGYIFWFLTVGSILSILMILTGIIILVSKNIKK